MKYSSVPSVLCFLNVSPPRRLETRRGSRRPAASEGELATFKLPKGFKAELVASEPDVVDPVALAFDEEGRMYVAEMRGYPNGGVGKGNIQTGKIKLLEDRDGDGIYETSTTFAEGLRFPMGVMPWKGRRHRLHRAGHHLLRRHGR